MNYRLASFTWMALLLLLAINVLVALFTSGKLQIFVGLLVASTMAALVMIFFMRLYKSDSIIRLLALSGFLWLSFMMVITLIEMGTR